MEINIKQQKNMLEALGAIDAQLSTIKIVKSNLDVERDALKADKISTLELCQHVDEDGNPAFCGGLLYTWCQICGTFLEEENIRELEKLNEK